MPPGESIAHDYRFDLRIVPHAVDLPLHKPVAFQDDSADREIMATLSRPRSAPEWNRSWMPCVTSK